MENILFTSIPKEEIESMIERAVRKVLLEKDLNKDKVEIEDLLTIKDAAKFLNLSVPTIYKYVQDRYIPCFKMGKRIYFKRNVLLDWIGEGKRKTNSEIELEATDYLSKRKSSNKAW